MKSLVLVKVKSLLRKYLKIKGEAIKEVRRSIAAKECHCPLANASYTNMLYDVPTMTRVGTKVLMPDFGKGSTAVPLPVIQSEKESH